MVAETNLDLVMLVDDNDTDNFISKRIIEITKFSKGVEVKSSGKTALDYLKENQNNIEKIKTIYNWKKIVEDYENIFLKTYKKPG